MKRKHIFIIIIILVVGLIIYKLSSNKKQLNKKNSPVAAKELSIPVKVATATLEQVDISILKTGALAPFIEAKVLSAGSGTIKDLRFQLGDHVKEGQILATLDSRLLELDFQKSQTNAGKLGSDLQTYEELLEGGAATQEKVNELRQSYSDAVNQSNQIRKQISDANIKSPTSGTISQKLVEQGMYVNAGAELGLIVNQSKTKVQVQLTETEVYQITEGQQVVITTDVYPDKKFVGKIGFISPQADETRSYQVEILLNNAGNQVLRSGTFVYADFSKKSKQSKLMIPRAAITESVQNASVYVVNGNAVKLQQVKTGIEKDGLIEISSGLNQGDVVVVSGQINLKDGTKVSISK